MINYKFRHSKPLYPFEQLSIVLHPYSFYLLPRNIKEYFMHKKHKCHPTRFELDYLYKTKYFKVIPLLPNVDLPFIKKSIYDLKNTFRPHEKNRNRHISPYIFDLNLD